MAAGTVPYKSSFGGTIGAGMGSLFNGAGRRYYVLEHKVSSKYHRAGETQEIIVDNIEIGRDARCQVRFDESFNTVSRRHAAIVRDDDKWKLIQISRTNSTLLNGQPVKTEWYLQSGDEIQLSINGPKLGFIIPTGKKATIGSIGMTRRLSLFRQQALAPYKRAIWTLSCLLLLAVGGLTAWNFIQKNQFDKTIAKAQGQITQIISENDTLRENIARQDSLSQKQDSIIKALEKRKLVIIRQEGENKALSQHEGSVYFLMTTKVVVTDGTNEIILKNIDKNGERYNYSWIGTGFLLDDGRFITAKHCIESWKYHSSFPQLIKTMPTDSTSMNAFIEGLLNPSFKIVSYIKAVSADNHEIYFKSTDFYTNKNAETTVDYGTEYEFPKASLNDGSDWAYAYTNKKGSIHADSELAKNLTGGTELEILGYPLGRGALGTNKLGPLYGSCKTARTGLDHGLIEITGRNFESGNSGGPVFATKNGKKVAVGIVSYSIGDTNLGGIVPICNLK